MPYTPHARGLHPCMAHAVLATPYTPQTQGLRPPYGSRGLHTPSLTRKHSHNMTSLCIDKATIPPKNLTVSVLPHIYYSSRSCTSVDAGTFTFYQADVYLRQCSRQSTPRSQPRDPCRGIVRFYNRNAYPTLVFATASEKRRIAAEPSGNRSDNCAQESSLFDLPMKNNWIVGFSPSTSCLFDSRVYDCVPCGL